ncbi:MAG: hypothetical protein AB1486_27360 [Planctomycetota bacterium]
MVITLGTEFDLPDIELSLYQITPATDRAAHFILSRYQETCFPVIQVCFSVQPRHLPQVDETIEVATEIFAILQPERDLDTCFFELGRNVQRACKRDGSRYERRFVQHDLHYRPLLCDNLTLPTSKFEAFADLYRDQVVSRLQALE